MNPVRDLHEAQALIAAFDGDPADLVLPISEDLLDPVGVNMALITDRILARGWEPDGYEQRVGFRIYRYKRME